MLSSFNFNEADLKMTCEKFESCLRTSTDFNETELQPHKKKSMKRKKFELLVETCSDFYEKEYNQHKEKKKLEDKHEFSAKACLDFNADDFKQHKRKKEEKAQLELPVETCSDINDKQHNKKKRKDEKVDLPGETCLDFSEVELKQHLCLGFKEGGLKDKKKKKEKVQLELPAETCSDLNENEFKQHKKNKKQNEKLDLSGETCLDFDEVELKQHLLERKGKLRFELPAETCLDFNEGGLKTHKKKKKEKAQLDLTAERCSDFNKNEVKQHKKKKKLDLPGETCLDFNEIELKQHLKERKNKRQFELPTETCLGFSESGLKAHKKKKKEKEQVELLVETGSVFNVDESQQHKKKKKTKSELSNLSPQKKKLEETCTAIDKHEILPKKHKKKKKHSRDYTLCNEHDGLDEKSYAESGNKCDERLLITDDFDESVIKRKKHKKDKKYANHISSNGDIASLDEKSYTESGNKCDERLLIADDFDQSVTKHKKHKKDKKYTNHISSNSNTASSEQNSLQHSIQKIDKKSDGLIVHNASDDCDINLNKKYVEKCEKIKDFSNSKKRKHKKYNLSFAEISEDVNTINLSYAEKQTNILENNSMVENVFTVSPTNDTRNCVKANIDKNASLDEEICESSLIECKNNNMSNYVISDEYKSSPVRKHRHKHKKKCASKASEINDEISSDRDKNEVTKIMKNSGEHIENFPNKDKQNSSEMENSSRDKTVKYSLYPTDLDVNEDPVDFEVPLLHQSEKVHQLSKNEKSDFAESGVFIKTGKFTSAEDKIIQRNFEDFVKRYQLTDPFSMFGTGRYKKDSELSKILKAKHFYIRLAKGLDDRSLFSIYKRARVILNPANNTGKLTKNQIHWLKRMHGTARNKWNFIADTLGSTAERCSESYRWHEKDIAKGHFTEEEETQLIESLKKNYGISDLSCKKMKGISISWDKVAAHVPSRNGSQCRMHWANHLAWAPGSAREKWNQICYSKLVRKIKELNVKKSSLINWYKVYKSFKDFAPSTLYVQKRWLYLVSRINNYKNKSHEEIVDILCSLY